MRTAIEQIEERLPALLADFAVPGAAVALLGDGQVLWARGFGARFAGQPGDLVAAATPFEVASLSKPVFAYLVLLLCQEGKLNLDAPLCQYVEYQDLVKEPYALEVTARQVLCHTSGLPNWRQHGQPLRFLRRPGESFGYSGEGYVFLQLAVEQVMEVSLGELAERFVLRPLRMKDSGFFWRERFEGVVAAGHQADGTPLPVRQTSRANAAWSLISTAPDYARFVAGLLDPGQGRLMRSWLRESFGPQAAVEGPLSWGLGWGLAGTPAGSIWHWGANPGYRSFVAASLNAGTGVVVLTNHASAMPLCREVVKRALGQDHPGFDCSLMQAV